MCLGCGLRANKRVKTHDANSVRTICNDDGNPQIAARGVRLAVKDSISRMSRENNEHDAR